MRVATGRGIEFVVERGRPEVVEPVLVTDAVDQRQPVEHLVEADILSEDCCSQVAVDARQEREPGQGLAPFRCEVGQQRLPHVVDAGVSAE